VAAGVRFVAILDRTPGTLFGSLLPDRRAATERRRFNSLGSRSRGAAMITLHSDQTSGNCYKVRLLAAQLGLELRIVDVDVLKGESRTPAFLMLNPAGRVPVLELPGGRVLAESNAMLCYLAEGSALMPKDPFERARVLQWLFFEQHSHEPAIAAARFWLSQVRGGRELKRYMLDEWMERGYQALSVMERHLSRRPFFGEERYSIADIALYAYTHVAHEGEFDLATFPAVRDWLARVAAQPGHVDIGWRPSGA